MRHKNKLVDNPREAAAVVAVDVAVAVVVVVVDAARSHRK